MNELLISVSKAAVDPGWCRAAVLRDECLMDGDSRVRFKRTSQGNIYRGRVALVESRVEAAFVDLGLPKRGFLHVSDVESSLYSRVSHAEEDEKPPIESIFHPGAEVLVQVIEEGVDPKGPILTTYVSIAGRYLVFLPALDRCSATRMIEDEGERARLTAILTRIAPSSMAFIARMSSTGRGEEELRRDMDWLLSVWRMISKRRDELRAPAILFHELHPIYRALWEFFTPDIDLLWLDDPEIHNQVRAIVGSMSPGRELSVRLHEGDESLFEAFGIPDIPDS